MLHEAQVAKFREEGRTVARPEGGPSGLNIKMQNKTTEKPIFIELSQLHDNEQGQLVIFDARVNAIEISNDRVAIVLRDGPDYATAVLDVKSANAQLLKVVNGCTIESVVRVSGTPQPQGSMYQHSPDTTVGSVQISEFTVLGEAAPDLPMKVAQHGRRQGGGDGDSPAVVSLLFNERLNNRVLDVRVAATGAIFKLHAGMCQLIVEYMSAHDFQWIHTPRITNTNIEGDKEFFSLPYFNQQAWMAQSPQQHKQMAIAMDMKRVFEIGPLFRAEERVSPRHLTEFTGLDIEMVFQHHYHEVLHFVESLLVFVVQQLQSREKYKHLIDIVKKLHSSAGTFKLGLDAHGNVFRTTFAEAKKLLRDKAGMQVDPSKDFTIEEEAALGRLFRSPEHGETDIFTIDKFPAQLRPFYSQRNKASPDLANAFDIILRGREISSGSQRINSYTVLREAMQTRNPPLDPDAEKWKHYMGAFKAGIAPHGGCGVGLNRLLQGFLGLEDVREATLFPRDANRLAP